MHEMNVDPVTSLLTGGAEDREFRLRRMNFRAVVCAAIINGQFWIAVSESEGVVGTACWFPPGSELMGEWVLIPPPRTLSPDVSDHSEKQISEPSVIKFLREMEKNHTQLFQWWHNTVSSVGFA